MLMHLSSIFHIQCSEELSSLCGPYFCVMCYTLENIKIAVGYDGHMLSIYKSFRAYGKELEDEGNTL